MHHGVDDISEMDMCSVCQLTSDFMAAENSGRVSAEAELAQELHKHLCGSQSIRKLKAKHRTQARWHVASVCSSLRHWFIQEAFANVLFQVTTCDPKVR